MASPFFSSWHDTRALTQKHLWRKSLKSDWLFSATNDNHILHLMFFSTKAKEISNPMTLIFKQWKIFIFQYNRKQKANFYVAWKKIREEAVKRSPEKYLWSDPLKAIKTSSQVSCIHSKKERRREQATKTKEFLVI